MKVELLAKDGRTIGVNIWLPEGEIKKAMIISHGMGEHISRYAHFARACNEQGIAVFGANHRGHGSDAELLGHFADENGWQLLLNDIDIIVDYVAETYGKKPILFGHSMGSFAARHYAVQKGNKLAALVLCGSNHQGSVLIKAGLVMAKLEKLRIGGKAPSPFLQWLSFGNFNRKIKPLRTEQDWLCRDEAVVDAYIGDPYCGWTPTPQFWIDFLGGLIEMSTPEAFKTIPSDLPVNVISGDNDPVNNYGSGITALVNALVKGGVKTVDYKLYPEGRHELHNEINKEEVFQDLFNWFAKVHLF